MPLSTRGISATSISGFPVVLTAPAPGDVLVLDAFGRWVNAALPPPGPHAHDAADITTGVFANARLYSLSTVSTTDATTTLIATIATTGDAALGILIEIQAHRTGGIAGTAGDGAVFTRRLRAKREAGVVTLGLLQSVATDRDQPAWTVDAVVFGTNIQIRVTGAINNDIDWQSCLRIFEV